MNVYVLHCMYIFKNKMYKIFYCVIYFLGKLFVLIFCKFLNNVFNTFSICIINENCENKKCCNLIYFNMNYLIWMPLIVIYRND